MTEYCHFINGQWLEGKGESLVSINPANEKVIWQGFHAAEKEVLSAVSAARAAFPHWSALGVEQRLEYLNKFHDQLEKNRDEIAYTIGEEVGKPLWETQMELGAMINKIAISKTAYHERTGEKQKNLHGMIAVTRHKAHGVLAVLGPFNFPAHLPNGHIVPALLAGNTIVFKPSDYTPQVAIKMLQCWEAAGLPPGVINLIQGGVETAKALASADIDGLLFTGSYNVGKLLHQQFAGHPEKILALEMGGNNPLIVWDVADLQAAAYFIIQSAFVTAGQRCNCARRLLLPNNKKGEAILAALTKLTQTLQVGAFDQEPQPFMGPVISTKMAEQLLQRQDELLKQGAQPLLKMKRLGEHGAFVSPAILDVTECVKKDDQEIFGPILQVTRCDNFDEAIDAANATEYGLSAGVISDSAELFQQFYERSRAGVVNWNRPLTGAPSDAPFGGIGKSGNHHPSAYYAADYCAYPVVSLQADKLSMPERLTPGVNIHE